MNKDIAILLGAGGRAMAFDPVERAGLTPAQTTRMEQLLMAVGNLRDGAGLVIFFEMDFWIAAQLTAALYDAQGQANPMQFKGPELQ